MSHEDLEKAYDGTLNKVNDREVVDGTVTVSYTHLYRTHPMNY